VNKTKEKKMKIKIKFLLIICCMVCISSCAFYENQKLSEKLALNSAPKFLQISIEDLEFELKNGRLFSENNISIDVSGSGKFLKVKKLDSKKLVFAFEKMIIEYDNLLKFFSLVFDYRDTKDFFSIIIKTSEEHEEHYILLVNEQKKFLFFSWAETKNVLYRNKKEAAWKLVVVPFPSNLMGVELDQENKNKNIFWRFWYDNMQGHAMYDYLEPIKRCYYSPRSGEFYHHTF
jgi:hypothetical protein